MARNKDFVPRGRLIVHAANVHQGGGRSLLLSLAHAVSSNREIVFLLDERMEWPDSLASLRLQRVKPSVSGRFLAEWWLKENVTADDVVLCFGNLPPLFHLPCHVTVFMQNRYLIDGVTLRHFPWKTRLRLAVERLWLSSRISNADDFIVQTISMKTLLERRTTKKIFTAPFVTTPSTYSRSSSITSKRSGDTLEFFYVASGEPHKNHRRLVEAWCLLAQQGVFPALRLTLDKLAFPDLHNWIEQMRTEHGLDVENLGSLSHGQVLERYKIAAALIFPSNFESFGLPLVEARQAGLPILASELDYVRDVVDPEETFDPSSALSIARAVKRHLEIDETPLPLQDASSFLKLISDPAIE